MKITYCKGIAAATILVLSPMVLLPSIMQPIMQQAAIAQSAQSVAPELQDILPQLRQQTRVPILLPSALPSVEAPIYVSLESGWSLYTVNLGYTPDCSGSACFLGSFSAHDTREALEGETVELVNGVTGYLRPSCPICGDLSLAWEQDSIVYLIRYKTSRDNLLQMANSAIQSGDRVAVTSSQMTRQGRRTEQDLMSSDLEAIRQAVVLAVGRPGLPEPVVQKVVVEGAWGLATWQMGEAAGTVALWQEESWEVYPLGGGMPDAEAINQSSDIPVDVAQRLLDRAFPN